MIRCCAVLLLAGMCAGAANQTDLPAQLSLSQALRIALTNSSTIREAMANLDQASGQYNRRGSYLPPQLNLVAGQSYETIGLARGQRSRTGSQPAAKFWKLRIPYSAR